MDAQVWAIDSPNTKLVDDAFCLIPQKDGTTQVTVYIALPSRYVTTTPILFEQLRQTWATIYWYNEVRALKHHHQRYADSSLINEGMPCFVCQYDVDASGQTQTPAVSIGTTPKITRATGLDEHTNALYQRLFHSSEVPAALLLKTNALLTQWCHTRDIPILGQTSTYPYACLEFANHGRFTSPLRKFPDLVNQLQIEHALSTGVPRYTSTTLRQWIVQWHEQDQSICKRRPDAHATLHMILDDHDPYRFLSAAMGALARLEIHPQCTYKQREDRWYCKLKLIPTKIISQGAGRSKKQAKKQALQRAIERYLAHKVYHDHTKPIQSE